MLNKQANIVYQELEVCKRRNWSTAYYTVEEMRKNKIKITCFKGVIEEIPLLSLHISGHCSILYAFGLAASCTLLLGTR